LSGVNLANPLTPLSQIPLNAFLHAFYAKFATPYCECWTGGKSRN
jgi:hypothetical protein